MRKVAVLALVLTLASLCAADVVYLKSGAKVEGKVTKNTAEVVTVETQTAVLTFPREVVEKVERGNSLLDTYREKLAAAKTVEDYQGLLSWCEANRFDTLEVKERLRDAAAARRRAENPDTYCRECAAYGQVGCDKCRRPQGTLQDRGTGKAALPCTQCRGGGTERCTRCGGSGQAPCVRCNSSGSVSVACNVCNGTGTDRCPRCGGSGTITCPNHVVHLGVGGSACPRCGSWGAPGQVDCPDCGPYRARTRPCSACKATGRISVPCPSCLGKRTVQCMSCGHKGVVACSGCGGKGTVEGVCPKCEGQGLVPCAACQGKGINPPKVAAPKLPAAR